MKQEIVIADTCLVRLLSCSLVVVAIVFDCLCLCVCLLLVIIFIIWFLGRCCPELCCFDRRVVFVAVVGLIFYCVSMSKFNPYQS